MTTGLVYDPAFLRHDTGHGHPERPARLVATLRHLEQQPWFSGLARLAPQPPDLQWVRAVHDGNYISRVDETCRGGEPWIDTPDCTVSRESCEIALLAAGAALTLADEVVTHTLDNGFALVRPPGHHAERELALGFCLFNSAAIAARYLQRQHGLDKILVLDWDVHHGNGTQHAFEEDPSVLYVSLHQYPYYPGTGAASETGSGRGAGATVNCPMRAGSGDADYERAFREIVLPKVNAFRPQAVILSAGFDAHRDDPLAGIELTTPFYGWMTERMLEVAAEYADGRLISLLEGGYSLTALAECVAEHLRVLSGQPRVTDGMTATG